MPINQGLKAFAESTPDFDNQSVQNMINLVNTGWVEKTRTLAQKVDASTVLTVSQKNDLNDTLDTQPYLNLGRTLEDLDLHTAKIFTGALGEAREDGSTGTFLEHVQSVQSFVTTVPSLFGHTADFIRKGVEGHFGTVSGSIDAAMATLKEAVVHITERSDLLSDQQSLKNGLFQTATQNIINFLDALGDSTSFDESTFNSLQSAFQTAANEFDTTLQTGEYATFRTNLINSRKTIVDQIALEVLNLGALDTYSTTLDNVNSYLTLTDDQDVRNLIVRNSANTNFKSYFQQYATRNSNRNPLYEGVLDDSSEETAINEILQLRGLPDVTDFLDLDAVAAKATRDDRLKTTVSFTGKNTEEIIILACDTLQINKKTKNINALSKTLLENMNRHDRETIKTQLNLNQQIDTLS